MLYASTQNKAIRLAKKEVKKQMNVSRISEHLIKYTTCNCGCGESLAIELVTFINKDTQYTKVGICYYCATGKGEPMTADTILSEIKWNGGLDNFRNWNTKQKTEWVKSNYNCSSFIAKKVAQLI
jgi:hypothetical protein